MYYHSQDPGFHYPSDQALTSSGQTLSTTLIFTAPSDGNYDVVVFSTGPTLATIKFEGKLYGPG
jgi:hypothetical protein